MSAGSDPAMPAPPMRPVAGRIGILGGTFDPIHVGHLVIAEEVRETVGLERVLFLPASQPWQKRDRRVAPIGDRLAMVELAIADAPAFELSRLEAARPGPSYTVETVERLAAELAIAGGAPDPPGTAPDLWFILSDETLRGLPTWHRPEGLLAACRLAVVPRPGRPRVEPAWLQATFPGATPRVMFLDGPRLDISASAIRARVAAGRSIRYLVPDAVAAYIGDHGLYTGPTQEEHPS